MAIDFTVRINPRDKEIKVEFQKQIETWCWDDKKLPLEDLMHVVADSITSRFKAFLVELIEHAEARETQAEQNKTET